MNQSRASFRRTGAWIWAALLLVVSLTRSASAHEPFEITTHARLFEDRLDLTVTMASATAALLCPQGTKPEQPGDLDLEGARPELDQCASFLYTLFENGAPLRPIRARVLLTAESDFETVVTYPRPESGTLSFDAIHLSKLRDPTYGAVLTATSSERFLGQALLRADARTLEVSVHAAANPGRMVPPAPSAFAFLRLGVEHILTGYDHLLFLLGVLIGCRRIRSAIALVTTFTLAHSITLALAALETVALPASVVEPLIAASIVFVGVESLVFGDRSRARLPVTFVFGLIHGFGFAGVLRELGLGQDGSSLVLPLLSFNAGVEIGQAAFALLLFPLLLWARAKPKLEHLVPRGISLLVCAMGLYWLADRTLFS